MRVSRTASGLMIAVDDEAETERIGHALARAVGPGTVIGLVGPLGAGKTRDWSAPWPRPWASTPRRSPARRSS